MRSMALTAIIASLLVMGIVGCACPPDGPEVVEAEGDAAPSVPGGGMEPTVVPNAVREATPTRIVWHVSGGMAGGVSEAWIIHHAPDIAGHASAIDDQGRTVYTVDTATAERLGHILREAAFWDLSFVSDVAVTHPVSVGMSVDTPHGAHNLHITYPLVPTQLADLRDRLLDAVEGHDPPMAPIPFATR